MAGSEAGHGDMVRLNANIARKIIFRRPVASKTHHFGLYSRNARMMNGV